jgi:hypothetical protein
MYFRSSRDHIRLAHAGLSAEALASTEPGESAVVVGVVAIDVATKRVRVVPAAVSGPANDNALARLDAAKAVYLPPREGPHYAVVGAGSGATVDPAGSAYNLAGLDRAVFEAGDGLASLDGGASLSGGVSLSLNGGDLVAGSGSGEEARRKKGGREEREELHGGVGVWVVEVLWKELLGALAMMESEAGRGDLTVVFVSLYTRFPRFLMSAQPLGPSF